MSTYDRWDFVLGVLDALKAGGELVIDGRQVFRVDVGRPEGRELAHECATAAEFLRKHRAGHWSNAGAIKLIVRAGLSHQHRCAGCDVLLEAFGRGEEPGKWSCEKCSVAGATVASVEDPKERS